MSNSTVQIFWCKDPHHIWCINNLIRTPSELRALVNVKCPWGHLGSLECPTDKMQHHIQGISNPLSMVIDSRFVCSVQSP